MITEEQLIEFGFKKNEGDLAVFFAYEKVLDEDLILGVSTIRNVPEFCIHTIDGTLFLSIKSLEDLKVIESSISDYEPN